LATGEVLREKLTFDENALLAQLTGPGGVLLKVIEREMGLRIHARGNQVTLIGPKEQVELGSELLGQLYALVRRGQVLDEGDLVRAARALQGGGEVDVREVFSDSLLITSNTHIRPKSPVQKAYVDAIRDNDIVFGMGPAGTGKTYLAMAMAMSELLKHEVKRIILARPAVEAGERLGFLPGDMMEKVNPYLRPLYDALHDMLEPDRVEQMLGRGQIEVAPLAFMRGRTLNSSFVILDEAQNATSEQMMMFLTRLGFDSKAVVTGDITQTDLPAGAVSGLAEAGQLLRGIRGIGLVQFTERDVVRHPLVQKIIKAYEARNRRREDSEVG